MMDDEVVIRQSFPHSYVFSPSFFSCSIDYEDANNFCLAEVGRNGIHTREIADDDHPLSWTASPFYNNMHDIYLCKRTQVPISKDRKGD